MKKILLSLLAIALIIEEWLWDTLTVFGHVLAKYVDLKRFDYWLIQTTPTVALIAFMIPVLIVIPINLMAFELLASGLILQGILLEIMAKLLATFLIARVFTLTKPQLLTYVFLETAYITIIRWLQWAHDMVAETAVYRLARQIKIAVKTKLVAALHIK